MKAITYHRYGGPEVFQLEEMPLPEPKADEVLIRTKAVSLNPYDWHFMLGTPYFIRLQSGLTAPKNKVIGNDVSGTVEKVGKDVHDFKPGDRVLAASGLGGLAEYTTAKSKQTFRIPESISFEEGAAMVIAGGTAYSSLVRYAEIKTGQHVLVNGAAGGVGHFTVQIANTLGAYVTGVCSTGKVDLVKTLGATDVIDYTSTHPTSTGKRFDVVIDNVGNLNVADFKRLIKPGGVIVIVGYTNMGQIMSLMFRKKINGAKVMVINTASYPSLPALIELVQTGKVKTVINRTYPLEQSAEAMEYLLTGKVPGKVVITL